TCHRDATSGPPPGDDDDDDSTGVFANSLTSTQSTTLDSLASLLGTDSTSLLDELRSGTSLSDLVASKGVDSGALANVLENGLLYDQRL
ncbi:hypothetical protein, partial [Kineosporia sp. A_224]|uniref:hypothetical protein n=1 Tax=Kineosporia sp. A_224 TaxID=1962180 RepID=UPI001E5BDDBF